MSEPTEKSPPPNAEVAETSKKPEQDTAQQAEREAVRERYERMRDSFVTTEDVLGVANADERTRGLVQQGLIYALAREKYNAVIYGKDVEGNLPQEEQTLLPDVITRELSNGTKIPSEIDTLERRFAQKGMAALEPFLKAKLKVSEIDAGIELSVGSVVGVEGSQERTRAADAAFGSGWRERLQQNLLGRSTHETMAAQRKRDLVESTKKRGRVRAALDRLFGSKAQGPK